MAVPYLTNQRKGPFAYVSVQDINKHLKTSCGRSFEEHNELLDKHAVLIENLVVINENDFKHHLSSQVMPSKMKESWCKGKAVVKSFNPLILKDTLEAVLIKKEYISSSVNVSSWLRCQEVNHDDVTMSEINIMLKSYKNTGFGSQNTVKSVGFVNFQGIKNKGNRVMPSPVTGPGTSSDM
eukprot:8112418-Ditylum_brightwellii.AAC.1